MKKLINSLLLILIMSGVVACRSDFDPQEDGNHRFQKEKVKPMMKTVRMSFGGDFITESEEPLLRAEDGDTYSAINVFRSEVKEDGTTEAEERYAYGLFKGTDNITIDVETGYLYRFEASILIEREDKVVVLDKHYDYPFKLTTLNDSKFNHEPTGYYKDLIQHFQYTTYKTTTNSSGELLEIVSDSERIYFCQLTKGTAYVDPGKDREENFLDVLYPRVKRFYGTTSNFNPIVSEEVEIDMDYKCFGLSVIVESLPSGSLTIEDITTTHTSPKDSNIHNFLIFPKNLSLVQSSNEELGVFSMNDLLASSDTFHLKFTWNKGGGAPDIFYADVTVKPKVKKILKVNVTGSTNYNTKGNIVLNIGSTDLTDENINVDRDADNDITDVNDNSQPETGE